MIAGRLAIMTLAACLMAQQATAQDFRAEVTRILDEVAQAAADETLIPTLLGYEDPRVTDSITTHYGVAIPKFRASVLEGYARAVRQTDLTDFSIYRDAMVFGETDGVNWAVVSYRVEVMLLPSTILPATCNRLVFNQAEDGAIYAAMVSTDLNARLVGDAIDPLRDPIARIAADCPPDLS